MAKPLIATYLEAQQLSCPRLWSSPTPRVDAAGTWSKVSSAPHP
jgi:hypothetical protein